MLWDHAPVYPEARETIVYYVQQFILGKHANYASKKSQGSKALVDSVQDTECFVSNDESFDRPIRSNCVRDASSVHQASIRTPLASVDTSSLVRQSNQILPPLDGIACTGDLAPPIVNLETTLIGRSAASNGAHDNESTVKLHNFRNADNHSKAVELILPNLQPLQRTLATYAYIHCDQKLLDTQRSLVGFIEQQQGLGQMDSACDISKRAIEWVSMNGETVWPAAKRRNRRAGVYEIAADRSKIENLVRTFMHDIVNNKESIVLQELRRTRFSRLALLLMAPGTSSKKRMRDDNQYIESTMRLANCGHAMKDGAIRRGSVAPEVAKHDRAQLVEAFSGLRSNECTEAAQAVRKAPTGKDDGGPSLAVVLRDEECGLVVSNKEIKTGRSNAAEAHTSSYRPIEQADRERRFNFHGDYMGLIRPLVPFERIMFDCTMFHVRVARDIKGHSHQMELEEAHYVSSFWAGVKKRILLLGYEFGSGVLIADLHWLSPPTKTALRTHSDHHLLMKQIQHWPGWKDSNQTGSCNIHLVLEE